MRESVRLSTSVMWSFVAVSINAFVALFISILLGRLLGPSDLGLYRLARTIAYLLSVFIGLGIPSAITKFTAESINQPNLRKGYFTAAFSLSVILGSIFTLAFFIFAPQIASLFENGELTPLLQLISPLLLFFFINSMLQSYLVGLRKMSLFSTSIILENTLMAIFTTTLVIQGWGASGAVLGIVTAALVNALYLSWAVGLRANLNFTELLKRMKVQLKFGLNILASTAINQINYRADVLALGYFQNNESVGYYSVGITLGNFFFLIPKSIQKVTYPTTAEYWGTNQKQQLQLLLTRSTRYTTSILLLLAFPFLIFAKDVTFLLYGSEFAPSVIVLQIIVVGIVINGGLSNSVGGTLPAIGRPELAAKISAISALMNVVLLVLLIPPLGLMGAALATGLSLTLRGCLGLYFNFTLTNTKIPVFWFLKVFFISFLFLMFDWFLELAGSSNLLTKSFLLVVHAFIIWYVYLSRTDRRFLISLASGVINLMVKRFKRTDDA